MRSRSGAVTAARSLPTRTFCLQNGPLSQRDVPRPVAAHHDLPLSIVVEELECCVYKLPRAVAGHRWSSPRTLQNPFKRGGFQESHNRIHFFSATLHIQLVQLTLVASRSCNNPPPPHRCWHSPSPRCRKPYSRSGKYRLSSMPALVLSANSLTHRLAGIGREGGRAVP